MNVVIVESVAKAKAINKYLGSTYKVLASYGHVRDLPSKDGSVEPDKDFQMHWDVDGRSEKVMKEIAAAVKNADKLILATDPDREGEAISWHILRILEDKKALKRGVPVERVTFNAVTKQSVLDAFKAPRQIDAPLVEAYLARRALDYLVGFTLSPVLWRKLPGARSAGRVQSVALRLVCDREAEIEAFKTDEYWTIEATLATPKGEEFRGPPDGHRRQEAGQARPQGRSARATAIKAAIEKGDSASRRVEKKAVKRNPYAPFATSTLQMDASRKLGFSAKQTMQLAQRLYEGVDIGGETVGLITYMRTDGVTIIPEAIDAIRGMIAREYLASASSPRSSASTRPRPRTRRKPTRRSARPTSRAGPQDVARHLDRDQARLYELIWKRTVASQMASAELEQTTRRHRGARAATASPTCCAPPARSCSSRASSRSTRRAATTASARSKRARMTTPEDDDSRRLPRAGRGRPRHRPRHRGRAAFHRSRRRASPRRRWSSAWRSWASAAPPPTPRRSPCCRSATTSASTRSA